MLVRRKIEKLSLSGVVGSRPAKDLLGQFVTEGARLVTVESSIE